MKDVDEEEGDPVNFSEISAVIKNQGSHTHVHIATNQASAVYKPVFNS